MSAVKGWGGGLPVCAEEVWLTGVHVKVAVPGPSWIAALSETRTAVTTAMTASTATTATMIQIRADDRRPGGWGDPSTGSVATAGPLIGPSSSIGEGSPGIGRSD